MSSRAHATGDRGDGRWLYAPLLASSRITARPRTARLTRPLTRRRKKSKRSRNETESPARGGTEPPLGEEEERALRRRQELDAQISAAAKMGKKRAHKKKGGADEVVSATLCGWMREMNADRSACMCAGSGHAS